MTKKQRYAWLIRNGQTRNLTHKQGYSKPHRRDRKKNLQQQRSSRARSGWDA